MNVDLDQILDLHSTFFGCSNSLTGISIIASFTTYDQAGGNEREIDSGNTIKLLSALFFKNRVY